MNILLKIPKLNQMDIVVVRNVGGLEYANTGQDKKVSLSYFKNNRRTPCPRSRLLRSPSSESRKVTDMNVVHPKTTKSEPHGGAKSKQGSPLSVPACPPAKNPHKMRTQKGY